MNLAFRAGSHTDYFVVESFIDSRELHCKRNAKDDMKRMLLNGEYLTKSDVRRKDKELQRKKILKRGNNKEKANYKGAQKGETGSKFIFI